MDSGGTNSSTSKVKPKDAQEIEHLKEEEEEEGGGESDALLPPRKGGMSRNSVKVQRSVQWNDNNGNKLAEVLVFQPSEASDNSEDDESDSCICAIM